jgi:hypothetical protein
MKALDALQAARAAGIVLAVDGEDLVLEAASMPPAAVLEALSQHKANVIALLRPGCTGWSSEDWHIFFDERAGIAEFDGGLPRSQAEVHAFSCCVAEWLNRNPVNSPSSGCLGCWGVDRSDDPLLPFGVECTGHAWLHSRCWPAWYADRRAQAIAGLATQGVVCNGHTPETNAEAVVGDGHLGHCNKAYNARA